MRPSSTTDMRWGCLEERSIRGPRGDWKDGAHAALFGGVGAPGKLGPACSRGSVDSVAAVFRAFGGSSISSVLIREVF